MTPEDAMKLVDPEHKKLLQKIVDVLDTLRTEIDINMLDMLLMMANVSIPILPKEMVPGAEAMKMDLTLVRIFVEQARKYDASDKALKAAMFMLGEET